MSNVLIVDDDKQVIQQLRTLIQDMGHQARFLLESEYLFPMLSQTSIDLVLLDVHMPGIDGISLLRKIREDSEHHDLPVIILTADTDDLLLARCFEAGGTDFINKPVQQMVFQGCFKGN